MALGTINTESVWARAVLFACLVGSFVATGFFVKWCFANAVSTRTDDKEVADIAVGLAPDDPQTHFAVAVMLEKTFDAGNIERSLAEYERAAELSPNNYLAWLELGKARDRSGDIDGAKAAFDRALMLAPAYSDVQWAYGNFLVRAGRTDEGFTLIRNAALAKPTLMPAAVTVADAIFDGNAARIRGLLGNDASVSLALAKMALGRKDYASAYAAWEQIPSDERRSELADVGRELANGFAAAKQFVAAANVTRDIAPDPTNAPQVGVITNGGFETLNLNSTELFDWRIGANAGQQIGLSADRKVSGTYCLHMIFNTTRAEEFREVSQTVAVESGGRYTLSGSYQADIKGGLVWEIADASDGKVIARTAALASTAGWMAFQSNFAVPPTSSGVIIRLVRDGCTVSYCPIAGNIWFDDMRLTKE